MEENTEQRVDLTLFSEKIQELKDRIASVIVGQEQTVDLVLTAILANGHVLIEGVPGVAKTLLARLVARLVDADFSRIQFTPDLMPSDVLGTTVFNMKTNDFDFHQGPVFEFERWEVGVHAYDERFFGVALRTRGAATC